MTNKTQLKKLDATIDELRSSMKTLKANPEKYDTPEMMDTLNGLGKDLEDLEKFLSNLE